MDGLISPPMLQVSLLMLALALVITAVGFRRVVYFVSLGYAFSIVAMAAALLLIYRQQLSLVALLQIGLLIAWGLRLGIFLLGRERKTSYQRQSREVVDTYNEVPVRMRFVIWLGVAVLYGLMALPALYTAAGAAETSLLVGPWVQLPALLLMAAGLGIEALADAQKSAFKAHHPRAFCDVGLYRWVRCPNYLGEILFWTGAWLVGLPFYTHIIRWLATLPALICLILIMLGSTRRLERTQEQRYGALPEYQAYVRSVPVLFPFVPIYTLKNIRVYLE